MAFLFYLLSDLSLSAFNLPPKAFSLPFKPVSLSLWSSNAPVRRHRAEEAAGIYARVGHLKSVPNE